MCTMRIRFREMGTIQWVTRFNCWLIHISISIDWFKRSIDDYLIINWHVWLNATALVQLIVWYVAHKSAYAIKITLSVRNIQIRSKFARQNIWKYFIYGDTDEIQYIQLVARVWIKILSEADMAALVTINHMQFYKSVLQGDWHVQNGFKWIAEISHSKMHRTLFSKWFSSLIDSNSMWLFEILFFSPSHVQSICIFCMRSSARMYLFYTQLSFSAMAVTQALLATTSIDTRKENFITRI